MHEQTERDDSRVDESTPAVGLSALRDAIGPFLFGLFRLGRLDGRVRHPYGREVPIPAKVESRWPDSPSRTLGGHDG